MKKTEEVVVEVTFEEYKKERLDSVWRESTPKEVVLMYMFRRKGIRLNDKNQPIPPVEITTDEIGKKFVIKQIQ